MKRGFLLSGHEVEVVELLSNGYLVCNIHIDEETKEEFVNSDKPYFVKTLHDKPILLKQSTEIIALEKKIQELQKERTDLQNQVSNIKKQEADNIKKYARFEQLRYLNDFIDGKITHYVTLGFYPTIKTFKESNDEYDRDKLKLLSLFGGTKGDLQWRLYSYSDGSGSHSEVYPVTSYENGVEVLRAHLLSEVAKDTDFRHGSNFMAPAIKHGIELPKEYLDGCAGRDRKSILDQIEKTEKSLSEMRLKITS